MKRKFLFLGVMGLMSLGSVQAQWSVTPEVGITVNHHPWSGPKWWLPSWRLGAGVDYDFNERWAVSTGLFFTKRRDTRSQYAVDVWKEKTSYYIPLLGKLYLPMGNNVSLSVAAGPYAGYVFSDKVQKYELKRPIYDLGQLPSSKVVRYLEWGAMIRVGLETGNWTIAAGYEVPLSAAKLPDGRRDDYNPIHTFSLSLGYKFYVGN